MYAMDAALPMLLGGKVRRRFFARHQPLRVLDPLRRPGSLGLELLAEERYASDTVTAIKVPEGMTGAAVVPTPARGA